MTSPGRSAALLTCALALIVAGCGNDDDGGSAASAEKATPLTLESAADAKGTVTYCTGKDTSGDKKAGVARFTKEFEAQGLSAKLLEFPESADEQRNQFVQRQEARSPECDIFDSDDQWTAEFVSQGWLVDVSAYIDGRKSEFIPASLKAGAYEGKQWACRSVALSAGGQVLTEDGKKSAINSPENVAALQLMVDGIKDGAAPKAVTTYMEEQARRAFEAGRATYMRNWPYAYTLGQKAQYGRTPTLTEVFADPEVKKAMPFAPEMQKAIEQGGVRPQSPVCPQVSAAIYKNVNQALSGQVSPEDALKTADEQINDALAAF
jgi:multiple sugar transport system substrate-binding protein